jgi:hypothetical protein
MNNMNPRDLVRDPREQREEELTPIEKTGDTSQRTRLAKLAYVLNRILRANRHTSHHRGRWSFSRYSPRISARIQTVPAIAKVSTVSLQFV